MSPLLQGSVAVRANRKWIDQIWFLRNLSATREEREFIAEIATKLDVSAFVKNERMPIGQLYIIRRGMCVKLWRFLWRNATWGEDMLLDNPNLIDHAQAVAVTFVEVSTLSRVAFYDAAVHFAAPFAKVHKQMRRLTIQRALLRHLALRNGSMGARSFVSRELASGYSYVNIDGNSVEFRQVGNALQHELPASLAPSAAEYSGAGAPGMAGSSTEVAQLREGQRQMAAQLQQVTRQLELLTAAMRSTGSITHKSATPSGGLLGLFQAPASASTLDA